MPSAPPILLLDFAANPVESTPVFSLGAAGSLLGLNSNAPDATDVVITWADGAIGVSDPATMANGGVVSGEVASPFAMQFQFTTRRAIRSISFKNFDPSSDKAILVAFNRLPGRRRAGESAFIDITNPDANLMPRTAIGFDTYEIRPNMGARFGIVRIDSPMPDPSMFVAQTPVPNVNGDTSPPDIVTSVMGGDQESSGSLPTWTIAVIAVVAVLLVTCIVVLIIVYIVKSRDDDDEHSTIIRDTPSTNVDAILNGGTMNHQTMGAFHNVATPPPMYEQVAPQTQFGTMQLHQQLHGGQQQQDDHGGIAYGAEMSRSSAQYGRVTEPDFFSEAGDVGAGAGGGGTFQTGQINYNTLPSHPQQTQQIQYSGLN
jgi:hypothetical protein